MRTAHRLYGWVASCVLASRLSIAAAAYLAVNHRTYPPVDSHDGMIVRQADELKVRSSSDRAAAARRADLDFAGLPQPRSAMRFEGELCLGE